MPIPDEGRPTVAAAPIAAAPVVPRPRPRPSPHPVPVVAAAPEPVRPLLDRVPSGRMRIAVAVADQGLSSLQNFVLLLVTARALTSRDFGRFSVVFAVAILALGVEQALVSEPLLLRASRSPETRRQGFATGYALVTGLGVATSVVLAVVGLADRHGVGGPLLLLAAAVPGLLVLDVARFEELAAGRVYALLSLDVGWTGLWVVGLVVLRPSTSAAALGTWGLSAGVVAIGYVVLRRVRFAGPRAVRAEWGSGDLPASSRSLLAELVATSSAGQVGTFAVSGFLGYAAAGGMRAAFALLGPLATLYNAARVAVVPEVIRAGGSTTHRGRRILGASTGVGVAVAVVITVVLLVLPDRLGRDLLGATWPTARAVLPAICAARIAGALMFRSLGALRADGRLADLAKARTVDAAISIVAVLAAAPFLSVVGTAWTIAGATFLGLLIFESVERRHGRTPAEVTS